MSPWGDEGWIRKAPEGATGWDAQKPTHLQHDDNRPSGCEQQASIAHLDRCSKQRADVEMGGGVAGAPQLARLEYSVPAQQPAQGEQDDGGESGAEQGVHAVECEPDPARGS